MDGKENQKYFIHKASDPMCICYLGMAPFSPLDNRFDLRIIQGAGEFQWHEIWQTQAKGSRDHNEHEHDGE